MSSISQPTTTLLQRQSRNPLQHRASQARRPWESSSPFACLRFACAISFAGLLSMASAQVSSSQPVDPRGPIAPWVGRTLVNAEGVQAVNYKFVPPAAAPWQPQWIWVSGAQNSGKVPIGAHFRKEFTLPTGVHIASAYAKVSADRVYRLWVNGYLVSRGPADPGNDIIMSTHWSHRWLYNQVDLAPYLHAGLNVIAAEVLTASMLPSYSLGHPGFAFGADVLLANGPTVNLSTGAGWKAEAMNAYSEGPLTALAPRPPAKSSPGGLLYDARLDDPTWRSGSFKQRIGPMPQRSTRSGEPSRPARSLKQWKLSGPWNRLEGRRPM